MNASRLVKSYAPLGLFLGGVGYLAWPYIDPENEPAQAKAEVPALEAKWLAPVFPPSAKRDPFRIVLPVVDEKEAPGIGPNEREGAVATARGPREVPNPTYRLGATLLGGRRRVAVIDDRVYQEGDQIEENGKLGLWKLARVEDGHVVIVGPRDRPLRIEFPKRSEASDPRTGALAQSKSKTQDKPDAVPTIGPIDVLSLLKSGGLTGGSTSAAESLPKGLLPKGLLQGLDTNALLGQIAGLGAQ